MNKIVSRNDYSNNLIIFEMMVRLLFLYVFAGSCSLFGQDYGSIIKNIEIISDGTLDKDSIFNDVKYNYLFTSEYSNFFGLGNVRFKKPNGKWIFLLNDKMYVSGRFRNGKQVGKWIYYSDNLPSGSYIKFKRSGVNKRGAVY